jgi:hypothetical protein
LQQGKNMNTLIALIAGFVIALLALSGGGFKY